MSNEKQVDSGRRGLLVATCAAGGVAGLATAGALVSTFQPSERAKAAGAPVEVDISALKPGEMTTVEWRGKPVWILKRTPEMRRAWQKRKTRSRILLPNLTLWICLSTATSKPAHVKNILNCW
jgi:ubiquinol-cytochrome c reductase iron-sulfur subunit